MKNTTKIFLILIAAIFFSGCNRNPLKIDVSGITDEVKIVRYEKELAALGKQPTQEQLDNLWAEYPDFTDLFSYHIIKTGLPDEEEWIDMMTLFLNDPLITEVYQLTEEKFRHFEPIAKKLIQAFKHYRYYFRDKPLPDIYTCVSGFNQSVFTTETFVGISLDKYLGHSEFYPQLGLPNYKQRKMIPEKIPSDVMYAWGMSEFEIGPQAVNLLDHMIHEGKLMYFVKATMPAENDTLITGFTHAQLKWCKANEAAMWTFLVENRMLYSSKQMDIVRYINDAPRTASFSEESPGRTGVWLGWQIVQKYMKRNPEIALPELMKNTDYQEILNESAYLP